MLSYSVKHCVIGGIGKSNAYELNDNETLDFDVKRLLQDIYMQYKLIVKQPLINGYSDIYSKLDKAENTGKREHLSFSHCQVSYLYIYFHIVAFNLQTDSA